MADWRSGFKRFAPDVSATLARFPFAVLLIALATVALLAEINGPVPEGTIVFEYWIAGFATAAIFAVAGKLVAETRPDLPVVGVVLRFVVPLLTIGAWQLWQNVWIRPYMLPLIGLLFLSVSPLLLPPPGLTRREVEDRFWWMNQQAITTAALAGVGLALIALGTVAIERSLDLLFGLKTTTLFYNWVLPVAIAFLGPVYWLSTLPRLADYRAEDLTQPDFLTRAVGFLGQFILTPLLLIYALILLAYGAQIAVTRTLPTGVLGWLVLTFVVTGAANWLLLHPEFLRARPLVRIFRRAWFWLTVIPLILYAIAVWVRIDAYGLTVERVALIAGGLWAALLAIAFLVPRLGDIRLIPGLAALILLIFSVGPWNYEQWPRLDQYSRLRGAFAAAGIAGPGVVPDWPPETGEAARSSLVFLSESEEGRRLLDEMMAEMGFEPVPADNRSTSAYLSRLPVPERGPGEVPADRSHLARAPGSVDLAATPVYLGRVQVSEIGAEAGMGPALSLRRGDLVIDRDTPGQTIVPLTVWLAGQGEKLTSPAIRFTHDGRAYALVVEEVSLAVGASAQEIVHIEGLLFAAPETAGALGAPEAVSP